MAFAAGDILKSATHLTNLSQGPVGISAGMGTEIPMSVAPVTQNFGMSAKGLGL